MPKFKKLEKKWQKRWEDKKAFVVKENPKKKKFFCLEMFPYPSSSSLHMGHAFNYTIGDIYARFKRMQGCNVLYPMGYDAFGLPAENAAIKQRTHPKPYTEEAIKKFIIQQKKLGLSYDWTRMLKTCDPGYYRWNQFFFLKFLEKGLAYRKKASVNWCPKCSTVLANEQVHNGACWRHDGTQVEIKQLEQWFIRTTAYAEELLRDIDKLDWPDRIKAMQRNWIGKSEGAEIYFEIENSSDKTSKVIIVHGSNSTEEGSKRSPPENERHWKPWLKNELEKKGFQVSNNMYPKDWNPKYSEWKKEFEKNRIDENTILIGHSAGGAFLIRWLDETKKKIKKLVLVSPGKAGKERRTTLYDLYGNKICKDIGRYVNEPVIIFTSDNDIPVHIKNACEYEKELPAKILLLQDKGHFTEKEMGTREFPELLNEIASKKQWKIFTTRPDTLFGVTFMVISAQHPGVMELVTPQQRSEVENFLKKIRTTKQEDIDKVEKEGVFTGSYAIHPITKEKIPVYVGNFVVAEYGSGMVMAVPAHDRRDFEFAKKYNISIKQVIQKKDIPVKSYLMGAKDILDEELKKLGIQIKETAKSGNRKLIIPKQSLNAYEQLVSMKMTPGFWNEYVGDEVVFIFKYKDGKTTRIVLNNQTEQQINKICEELNNSTFGSIWKMLAENDWYADSIVHTEDGTLINSGEFNGLSSKEAKEKISKYLQQKKCGNPSVQYKLRDWLISRQRYWGTPIPIIYCEECGIVPVPEKDLPILLPEKVTFGKGNPLETNKQFISTKCPKCKKPAKRETDTMDTFMDSSWYFLRYTDSKNNKAPFDKKKASYWMPVNQYIGGAEHATMHLIYARFFTKVLRDLGYVSVSEPFPKLFNQGMLHKDGFVMSKSRGNVVLPEEISEQYGIDAARFFLVSLASAEKDREWSDAGMNGSFRLIVKMMEVIPKIRKGKSSPRFQHKLNKAVKEITDDISNFRYNLAAIKIRDLIGNLEEEMSQEDKESLIKLVAPFCPHSAEEVWEKTGKKSLVSLEKWPVADEKKINEEIERQEKAIQTTITDMMRIMDFLAEKQGKEAKKIYLYVLPDEREWYDAKRLQKRMNKPVIISAVNDKNKYDPQNKASKAKPGKPAIYVE